MAVAEGASAAVTSVGEFLALTELAEIRSYLLRAERAAQQEPENSPVAISVRGEPEWIEIRCRMTLKTADATVTVDRSAVFKHSRPLELDEAVIGEFVEKVGVMTVYPYLREAAFTLAGNLGVSAPVMALVRAGSIHIGSPGQNQPGAGPEAQPKRKRAKKAPSGE